MRPRWARRLFMYSWLACGRASVECMRKMMRSFSCTRGGLRDGFCAAKRGRGQNGAAVADRGAPEDLRGRTQGGGTDPGPPRRPGEDRPPDERARPARQGQGRPLQGAGAVRRARLPQRRVRAFRRRAFRGEADGSRAVAEPPRLRRQPARHGRAPRRRRGDEPPLPARPGQPRLHRPALRLQGRLPRNTPIRSTSSRWRPARARRGSCTRCSSGST